MNGRRGFLNISEAPFLRLLLPYAAGMVIQYSVGGYIIPAISAIIATLFLIRYYSALTPRYKYAKFRYFGYAIFAIFLFAGSLNIFLADERTNSVPPASATTAVAKITFSPEKKEYCIQCRVDILQYGKQNGEMVAADMPAILFLQTDTLATGLKKGDIIIFREKLQPVHGNSNPYGYDYGEATRKKGYIYSQYVPSGGWAYIGHDTTRRLADAAQQAHDRLSKRIEDMKMRYRSEALVKALITGDTSQVTQSMRTCYSVAGLSHILAVSGLHTGIITYLIYLLLTPLRRMRARLLVPFITVIATWCYIYMVGMPVSAVRAGIMATLILIGDIIGRKETTINALLASAFLILLYNPYYIFDIGFQLSYTAVFSIFYLYPLIISRLPDGNGFKRKLSSIIAVTIAAQAGTLPLCIYYFHQLPLLGILSNAIVIPLLPFIMAVAIIAILFDNRVTTFILDSLLSFINRIASTIESVPFSSIDDIYIKPSWVIFMIMVVFGIAWGVRTKRSGIIVGVSCLVFVFVATELINMKKESNRYIFAIYDDNDITAINMASPWYNYVITPGMTQCDTDVKTMAGTFWFANLIPDVKFVSDSIKDRGLCLAMPYIVFGAEKVVILDSDRFSRLKEPDEKLFVDKAVITWGFDGNLQKVCDFFDIEEVIITSNVPWYIRNQAVKVCETLRIPYYDIKHEGAYTARFRIKNRRLVSR